MSEKVVRTFVDEHENEEGVTYLDTFDVLDGVFTEGERVVVISEGEYKRLKALSDYAAHVGDDFYVRPTPRKRCMNCDGNNVNAPCTCEGV